MSYSIDNAVRSNLHWVAGIAVAIVSIVWPFFVLMSKVDVQGQRIGELEDKVKDQVDLMTDVRDRLAGIEGALGVEPAGGPRSQAGMGLAANEHGPE